MAARDVVFVAAMLAVLGMGMFIMHFMFTTTLNTLVGLPVMNETSERATASVVAVQATFSKFDYLVLAFFVGSVLGLMVTGWLVGGHPVFMFMYFIVVIAAVIVGGVLSSVWGDVSTASVFAGVTVPNSDFPITNHLLDNLGVYAGIVGVLGLVVMFAKPQPVE